MAVFPKRRCQIASIAGHAVRAMLAALAMERFRRKERQTWPGGGTAEGRSFQRGGGGGLRRLIQLLCVNKQRVCRFIVQVCCRQGANF